MNFLTWKHIVDLDEPTSIYLSRFILMKCERFAVFVHRIFRADYARVLWCDDSLGRRARAERGGSA